MRFIGIDCPCRFLFDKHVIDPTPAAEIDTMGHLPESIIYQVLALRCMAQFILATFIARDR